MGIDVDYQSIVKLYSKVYRMINIFKKIVWGFRNQPIIDYFSRITNPKGSRDVQTFLPLLLF
jgi:hypothetical protein